MSAKTRKFAAARGTRQRQHLFCVLEADPCTQAPGSRAQYPPGHGGMQLAQANLLNDPIMRGPGFHFQVVAQLLDRLVMRAVHL